ncbi:amidase family protein, partial [Legionella sp. 29fVS95]
EFAMGSTNENSYFGAVKNPWDLERVPGGSSGGSAAAVAARLIPFATGSDTGGSIRQPAAFCGISGIKPTYGLVSRFGMVAYASSLDQAGPMANSAEELALVLQAMAGFDANDSTSVSCKIPDFSAALNQPIKGLRIGLPSCFFQKEVEADIQQAIRDAVKLLQYAGAEIVQLDLTLQPLWVPCYYVIACAEASSNLSRYDGIRFGYRSSKGNSLKELITNSRSEGFGREVKRRILTGTHVLSSGYFDDYYLQALKIRRLIQNELQDVLRQVDVILGPTTPTCAFKLGEKTDPIQNYLADVFTVAVNLAGLPALSIPAGFSRGLPIGMQLIGNHFSEAQLLNLAYFYQQDTNWHQARPTYKG